MINKLIILNRSLVGYSQSGTGTTFHERNDLQMVFEREYY